VDEAGTFSSTDVREQLRRITGRDYDIPNFAQHLDKFSQDNTRGPILQKTGAPRRFRFRFLNPLLQPYVIMRGILDGMVDDDLLGILEKRQQGLAAGGLLF
jgi:hypothetical protein